MTVRNAFQMTKSSSQNDIPVSAVEEKSPFLLHAVLGAHIAREKYDVKDQEILDAIACHTTGKPDMTLLEKIIFISDYIEPMRSKAENLPLIRHMAFEDLDLAVYTTLRDTLVYLEKEKTCLDNQTTMAYNYYRQLIEEREKEA